LRLLLALVAVLSLAACRGGDHPRPVSRAVPTPTEKQAWSILNSALLTRFDMPGGWHVMQVRGIGQGLSTSPCTSSMAEGPSYSVAAEGGFEKEAVGSQVGPIVEQSIYEFPPDVARQVFEAFRDARSAPCEDALYHTTFTVSGPETLSLGDNAAAIMYTKEHAVCGTLAIRVVLALVDNDLIRVEQNSRCEQPDPALGDEMLGRLVERLRAARDGYVLSLTSTPDASRYDGLPFALLSARELPPGWRTALQGETALTGYGFCGDRVDRGQSLTAAMVAFDRVALGGGPDAQLDALVDSPSMSEELLYLRGDAAGQYVTDWIDSAESCARQYAATPTLQESLAKMEVPELGDRTVAYRSSGFFGSSSRVLVVRGRFVMQIELRVRAPDVLDPDLFDNVLKRAVEKFASQEQSLAHEFEAVP